MDRRLDRETVVESYYITYYKKKTNELMNKLNESEIK